MPHALAAHAAMCHFDAAAVADHTLVFHTAVLAAGAFPVLFGAEDALTEQTVLFGAVGAVVDRLRLFDLAEGPGTNIVGAGEADAHRPVVINPVITRFAGACAHKDLLQIRIRTSDFDFKCASFPVAYSMRARVFRS